MNIPITQKPLQLTIGKIHNIMLNDRRVKGRELDIANIDLK